MHMQFPKCAQCFVERAECDIVKQKHERDESNDKTEFVELANFTLCDLLESEGAFKHVVSIHYVSSQRRFISHCLCSSNVVLQS